MVAIKIVWSNEQLSNSILATEVILNNLDKIIPRSKVNCASYYGLIGVNISYLRNAQQRKNSKMNNSRPDELKKQSATVRKIK